MKIVSRCDENRVLFEAEASEIKELVELAVKQGVSLKGANLSGAYIRDTILYK